MSREVIGWGRRDGGLAVTFDPGVPALTLDSVTALTAVTAEAGDELDDRDDYPATPRPPWLDRLGDRGRRRLLGLTLVIATAFGWSAPALGTPDTAERTAPVVVATVTENHFERPSRGAGSTTLRMSVSNLSTTPVRLVRFDSAYLAADVTLLRDAGATVDAGATLLTDVAVTVLCTSSSPLVLPTLQLRDGDGIEFHVAVAGAVQALADSCAGGDTPPVLSLAQSATIEESRLKVPLSNLGDRTVRLLAMTVDDVSFGGPLPSTMDTPTKSMWLNPPTTCPDLWRVQGLPTTLHVVVATALDHRYDAEGTADIPVPIGPVLAQWLSTTACKGVS